MRDAIAEATVGRQQRPAWLVRARGASYGSTSVTPAGRTATRPLVVVLIAIALAVALVAGLLAVGGLPSPLLDIPRPSPSAHSVALASPSVQPSPTVQPSPSPTEAPTPSPSAVPSPPGPWTASPDALAYLQGPADPLSSVPGTLYVARHDGSEPHQVATKVESLGGWSASGRYLAIVRAQPSLADYTVSTIKPDGTVVGTIDAGAVVDVRWSPTDDILYVSSLIRDKSPLPHPRFALYRPDGVIIRVLAVPRGVSTAVNGMDWSPDGRSVVIAGCSGCEGNKFDDTPDLQHDLWILPTDGGPATNLTNSPYIVDVAPRWSPDGRWIAYWATCGYGRHVCGAGTWLIKPDGSPALRIFDSQTEVRWSPDGTELASRLPSDAAPYYDVYVSGPGGSNDRKLTATGEDAGPLAWSPDGTQILYVVEPISLAEPTVLLPSQTWLMNADGSGQRQLGTQWLDEAWRPAP
jgi:dipeptidyl aminopeptidase/acylaminoacyl peptidase